MTVISKLPPLLRSEDSNLFGKTEEPYERQVTADLASALVAIEQATESAASTGEFQSFENAVRDGVSANLCEAIAGLSIDDDTSRAVDLQSDLYRSPSL